MTITRMTITRRRLLSQLGAATAASATLGAARRVSLLGAPGPAGQEAAGEGSPLRLDRNENPYGASPGVKAVMRNTASDPLERTDPEAVGTMLRERIAKRLGVTPGQVVLGCGSGEILRMAVAAFLTKDRPLMCSRPTYGRMAQYAERAGVPVVSVPLGRAYTHDLESMLSRLDGTTAGVVYICNPNNPTGTVVPRAELDDFMRRLPPKVYVVIDEAYHEYVDRSADYVSFIDRPAERERVIVVRSFSKLHGLASLRVGYGVSAPQTISRLDSCRLTENVNVIAAHAAMAALGDDTYVRDSIKRNSDDRQEFYNQVDARMLRAIDSRTNFVMLDTGRPASVVLEHFKAHDVWLREVGNGFDRHVRVSLGTPAAMIEFWRVWDLLGPKMVM